MRYNLEGRVFRSISNTDNAEVMLGECMSTPERLPDTRLKFEENRQWLSGDTSSGHLET
jgi:hypothetical protein